jgi:DNA-directed RNA polymerase subunit RPC12/RpoP
MNIVVQWIIAIPFLLAFLFLYGVRQNNKQNNTITKRGVHGAAGLQCPHCGGTQFQAVRSAGGMMAIGVFAPKSRVKCVTCGTKFFRG